MTRSELVHIIQNLTDLLNDESNYDELFDILTEWVDEELEDQPEELKRTIRTIIKECQDDEENEIEMIFSLIETELECYYNTQKSNG